MAKNLFNSVKVIYDAHTKSFDVYYRKWFVWKLDSTYKFDDDARYPIHYATKDQAKQRAIDQANALLDTVEIYRKSNISYYY